MEKGRRESNKKEIEKECKKQEINNILAILIKTEKGIERGNRKQNKNTIDVTSATFFALLLLIRKFNI